MKRVFLFLLCLMPFVLSACDLPLDILEGEAIVCQVTEQGQQTLTVVVQNPDLHYDEGDTLVIQYQHVADGKALSVGSQITFTYDYLNDVTVQNELPYLKVDSISLTQWTPPETESTKATDTTETVETSETTQSTAEVTE